MVKRCARNDEIDASSPSAKRHKLLTAEEVSEWLARMENDPRMLSERLRSAIIEQNADSTALNKADDLGAFLLGMVESDHSTGTDSATGQAAFSLRVAKAWRSADRGPGSAGDAAARATAAQPPPHTIPKAAKTPKLLGRFGKFIRWLKLLALREAVCLFLLILVPCLWYEYNDIKYLWTYEYALIVWRSSFLVSSGIAMVVSGCAYRTLPIDLIPDWIPRIGTLDNELAAMTIGAGAMLSTIGYKLGYGEPPVLAVLAVESALFAHRLAWPFVGGAVTLFLRVVGMGLACLNLQLSTMIWIIMYLPKLLFSVAVLLAKLLTGNLEMPKLPEW